MAWRLALLPIIGPATWLWRRFLDKTCGELESFDYVSTTTPDESLLDFHARNWSALDSGLRERAVRALRAWLTDEDREAIQGAIIEDPAEWWAGHHFFFGMSARNALRRAGVLDEEFPSENLDDYYVPALEAAVGCRDW